MKDLIMQDIKIIYQQNHYISEKSYYASGKYKKHEIKKYFNTFNDAIDEINKNSVCINYNKITKQELCNDILNIYNNNNKTISSSLYKQDGKYEYKYIIDFFGSFNNMLDELNLKQRKFNELSKKEILRLGQEYFQEFKTLKKNEFLKNKHVSYTDFNSKFNNFNEFIELLDLTDTLKSLQKNKISNKLNGNSNFKGKINISKEDFDKTALSIYKNKGTNNFCDKYFYQESGFTPNYIYKFYKNFGDMKKQLNLYSNKELFLLDRSILDNHLLELYFEHGKLTRELIQHKSPYGYKLIISIYGGHQEMIEKLKIKPLSTQIRGISTDMLLNDLLNLYNSYNSLSKDIISKYGKYNYRLYYTKLGSIDTMYNYLGLINQSTSTCVSKIGLYCINIISEILQEQPILEKTFDWLINSNTGYKLKLDAYFPQHNIAIEYDGIQHYEYISYYYATYDDFLKRQERDKIKNQLCENNNVKLIRIKYNEPLNIEYLRNKINNYLREC